MTAKQVTQGVLGALRRWWDTWLILAAIGGTLLSGLRLHDAIRQEILDVKMEQSRIIVRLDALAIRAPAPADTTRYALRSLDQRLTDVETDLRELRRSLRTPR